MQNVLDSISGLFKNVNKGRTIRLSLLLFLFIALPLIFGTLKKQPDLHQNAQAATTTGTLWIYGVQANPLDDLAPGWTAKNWFGGGNVINRFNTTPIYTGTHSLSYQATAPMDEMDLFASAPFDISQYQYLTFYATPTQQQQLYIVYLLNAYHQRINPGNYVAMSQYGGVPIPGTWTVYDIPISAFNAGTTMISGIGIADANGGGTQLPIYFDDIAFSVNKGENIGPGPGNATALPTLVPGTPTPPYYPDISPWVYIIPGIIVFFAIFFE